MINADFKKKRKGEEDERSRTSSWTYLLDFCRCTFEQLNVSLAQDGLVFPQSTLRMFIAGEQNKRIPGGSSVREADEQNAVLAAAHRTQLFESLLRAEEVEHLLVGGGEGKTPHPHDDLVLLGEKLCHLVGGT